MGYRYTDLQHTAQEMNIVIKNFRLTHKIKEKLLRQCIKCNNFSAPGNGNVGRSMLYENIQRHAKWKSFKN